MSSRSSGNVPNLRVVHREIANRELIPSGTKVQGM
jgi:hypothetical protein